MSAVFAAVVADRGSADGAVDVGQGEHYASGVEHVGDGAGHRVGVHPLVGVVFAEVAGQGVGGAGEVVFEVLQVRQVAVGVGGELVAARPVGHGRGQQQA